ncbi:DUF4190 domain-containing protein [Promicromonospora sp. NPDC019610]|uniref:DUF4190 domain-containing protein n=1 Tax=Promicromonospora sp. NPDC019610 TaxID=3364405 RepID=UPI0037AF249B
MTENEGGTPRDPRDPQPETPPTQPLPGSTPVQGSDPTPTQPLPGEPYRAEQQPTPPQPAGQQGPPYGQQGAPTPYSQPGAPAAPQYGYGQTPPKNDLGVWALITGILSYVFCPLLLGIAAIITGTMSRRAADEGLANNRGMGTAGLILGWINVALVVLAIVFFVIALAVGLISGGLNGWGDMPNSNDWNY